jgi:hypothetical protein
MKRSKIPTTESSGQGEQAPRRSRRKSKLSLGEPGADRPPSPGITGKTKTAGQPLPLHHLTSQFTQRCSDKLWGWLGHLMDNLPLKGNPLKRSQSWIIRNLVAQPQELGLHRKPPNLSLFPGV